MTGHFFNLSCYKKAPMQTLHFDVSGMTCGGCTSSVQRALSQLDGVSHVEVNLNPGSASVTVEPGVVSAAQIESLLDDLGFEAKARLSN
jgi:copper chaperone